MASRSLKKVCGVFAMAGGIGCAKVAFEKVPSAECQGLAGACVRADGVDKFDYTVDAPRPSADILFVVDNSASMSPVQHQIAGRFPTFLDSLDGLDYQIAVTTTDISGPDNPARGINRSGALQDGRLISFGPGKILTRATGDKESLFGATLRREETLACESYLANRCPQGGCADYNSFCPSPDTRAIFAAALAVDRAEAGFFRAKTPLAVVIVSNADERAMGGRIPGYHPLEDNDRPETLIDKVRRKFSSGKSLAVHSIIIRPGDQRCHDLQRSHGELLFGWSGDVYARLSGLTGGVLGDICASDYGASLQNIGHSVAEQVNGVDLPCRPVNDRIQVEMTPDVGIGSQLTASRRVQFNRAVPPGTRIRLRFECSI